MSLVPIGGGFAVSASGPTSTSTTITAGTSSTWVGYGTGDGISPAAGSIASGGPLLNIATLYCLNNLTSGFGGALYFVLEGDVRDEITANFTKLVLDGTDYLFSANYQGDASQYGTLSSGNTYLQWRGIGTIMTSGNNYVALLE